MTTHFLFTPFLPDAYWVIPDKFLAGEYPGDLDLNRAQQRLIALLDIGIREFIDLTWEGELEPYHNLLYQEAKKRNFEVGYTRYPIPDLGIPTRVTMRAILDHIDHVISNGKRLYVHCWGGVGRTGTVVGCYLVRHGLSGPAALERLQILRRETAKWWRSSPETDEQRAMILSWQIGE
ncbi:MAG: protein-tyrosine phosphatase family protein [Thermanaerothrix sp.]|uniref:Tyrosine specific protein phosphatases domain-containing protein n=1 Tax=Thermanaerothrix solaris TaxID=3058434 RepID=A0ABU3NJ53_9CHLR|nr:hypothetical protein [Thermanaerothrix sp. 4228-RoL]MDT8896891.1 hypothetical protein [Thermanaerothrix sp. 4228-RoL]